MNIIVSVNTLDVCTNNEYFIKRVEHVYTSNIAHQQALLHRPKATLDYAFYFNCLAAVMAVAGAAMLVVFAFTATPLLLIAGCALAGGALGMGSGIAVLGLFGQKKQDTCNTASEQLIESTNVALNS